MSNYWKRSKFGPLALGLLLGTGCVDPKPRAAADERDYWREFEEWRTTAGYRHLHDELNKMGRDARAQGDLTNDNIDRIMTLLGDAHWDVRVRAISVSTCASTQRSKQRLQPAVVDRLADPVPYVRSEAARALRDIGDETAIPRLNSLLKDRDPAVVKEARKTISALSPGP